MTDRVLPTASRSPAPVERDGTSQMGRALPALDPDYVAVDDRDIEAQLRYAKELGKHLVYFDAEGRTQGSFSEFIGNDLSIEEVVAFLREPERFSKETSPGLFRPHRVLFFVFLKLLETVRREMNQITARHLDFYYREYLRLSRKPALPDRVTVLAELPPGSRGALLPRGSLLDAGVDDRGKSRVYATERELFASRAQIAKLSSLYIDRPRQSLRWLVNHHRNDKVRACEAMFGLALGKPLPDSPYADGKPLCYEKLESLHDELLRAERDYFLSLSELRELVSRRAERREPSEEWQNIHRAIEAIARKQGRAQDFTLPVGLRDLEACLRSALPRPFDLKTLSAVETIDDLYEQLAEPQARPAAESFILEALHFETVADFQRVIEWQRKHFADWNEINQILERAGQRRRANPKYILPIKDPTDYAGNIKEAIGRDDLDSYYAGVLTLERYFFLPELAELFCDAMQDVRERRQSEWSTVFSVLLAIHREKLRSLRRAQLEELHQRNQRRRLVDSIRYVLGEPAAEADDPKAIERLGQLLSRSDFLRFKSLAQRAEQDFNQPDFRFEVCSLLEIAQRKRLGEPPLEKQEWLNFHAAEDATSARRHGTQQESGAGARWSIFGAARPAIPGVAPPPLVGWALVSPSLMLAEGQRTITVTLYFRPGSTSIKSLFAAPKALPLRFELSTAKGFIECAAPQLLSETDTNPPPARERSPGDSSLPVAEQLEALGFVLTIDKGAPAIAPAPPAVSRCNSRWPMLRMLLLPLWDAKREQYVAPYPELAQRELVAARLVVKVDGLASLRLQNDDATLDSKKPFEPFTMTPATGSRLLIGHPELVGKRLDSLKLHIKWMGAPKSLLTHYAGYPDIEEVSRTEKTVFKATLYLRERSQDQILIEDAPLFGGSSSDEPEIENKSLSKDTGPRDPELIGESWLARDLSEWERCLALELGTPDFQHAAYPVLATSRALRLIPPYTPKCKSLTIDYSTSVKLRFDDPLRTQTAHRILHIHPFGTCDAEAERPGEGLPFLPQYANEGELYIGLRDVAAPQTVAIFFQMAEGSGNPDIEPQPIRWSYLSGNRFLPLDDKLLSDTTRGLRNSGIVELALPAAEPSTRIYGGLYYVRATLAQDTEALSDCCCIATQAVSAVFVDQGNSPAHYRQPLPAETITSLLSAPAGFAGVRQPYTSTGGYPEESDGAFATRVSERLRHKQRALSPWDYERLILARFPELYKVKCIPADPSAPGELSIIVIPDLRNRLPFEPFEPKAPLRLLAEVKEYVSALAPAFATVSVRNAHYTAVSVRLGVRFTGTGNDEFYKQQLCDELCRFLCPWAYEEGVDIVIGGRIYASSIIDFVDRRPYVDYVAGITLFAGEDGQDFQRVQPLSTAALAKEDSEGYFVGASRPDSVLLTARKHVIDVLSDDLYQESLKTGIDFMQIGFDFIVGLDS